MIIISDRDQVIAVAGGAPKSLIGKRLSTQMEELLRDRSKFTTSDGVKKSIPVISEEEAPNTGQVIYPIICEGDIIGSVVILGKEENTNVSITEEKLALVAASFLGKHMEN